MKTGTTIAGIVFKDGVVLGADTRATEGSIVCDKNCIKIHKIADNIYCCGAGTSADTENVTCLISSQLELLRLDTGCQPRVVTAMTRLKQRLFQYQGNVSAALVLGGIDITGPHIYTVYPHGSTDKLPFATMGSGSLAAMAVFERGFKDNLDEKEAVDLVDQAIQAGIFNDLGSGSNVDICVITRDCVKFSHNYRTGPEGNVKPERKHKYHFPRGTTEVLKEVKRIFTDQISVESVVTKAGASASMDTS
jgi:20S proteasome subunit beta 2